MRKPGLLALIAAGIFISSAAPAAQEQFSPSQIEADVRFLADDLLEGRGTGTRGYDLAANYVAQRFVALGLTPGNGSSWFQPVPFVQTEVNPARPSFVTINGRRFVHGEHVLVPLGITNAAEQGSAPVVFVGYGLEEPDLGLEDYRGVDVRGKIVAMLWGAPSNLPSEVSAVLQREKSELAARKGAVGVLTIVTPVRETTTTWAAQAEQSKLPRMRWVRPDGTPSDPGAPLKFSATLDRTATEALLAGTPLGNGRLYAMLSDTTVRPKAMPLPALVSVSQFNRITRISSPNVIGFMPGSDPRLRDEVILLTAHLDHLGIKSDGGRDRIYNGAMDNASGAATMLEVARAFAESPRPPRRSVAFVAVTAEEKGLLGSEYLANHPRPSGLEPVANVNLDMPILLYDFTDIIAYGAEHSTMGVTVDRAIRRMGVTLTPDPQPEQNIFVRSDHYNFVRKGIPSVFIKTGVKNGGRAADTAFRTQNYHKVTDDLSQKLNWGAAAKFAKLNYLIAREIADSPQRPLWYEGSYFGAHFATDQPKARR